MKSLNEYIFITVAVADAAQLASVYALLGGVSGVALSAPLGGDAKPGTERASAGSETAAQGNQASAGSGPSATNGASLSDGGEVERDAHGHPWSADLHAATKGTTKDGLWRMKVGVARPAPLPGFPVGGATGTSGSGTEAQATGSATTAGASSAAATNDEDDEFAAFRQAAANSDAKGAAAAATVAARKWTDADLGALCNQAAVKLGDPAPVKAIIADFIPEGQVAHSRNIPEDQREAFAKAVEAKAGIEFAG